MSLLVGNKSKTCITAVARTRQIIVPVNESFRNARRVTRDDLSMFDRRQSRNALSSPTADSIDKNNSWPINRPFFDIAYDIIRLWGDKNKALFVEIYSVHGQQKNRPLHSRVYVIFIENDEKKKKKTPCFRIDELTRRIKRIADYNFFRR